MAQVFLGDSRSRARDQATRPLARARSRAIAGVLVTLPALSVLLPACSPALDWRQFQPEGWPLVLSMPCRPADQQRSIALVGTNLALRLLSCSADDHIFAVASADVGDPAQVGPALQALAAAAQANVRATIVDDQPAVVPGMTPQAAARRWRLRGQLPDARPVSEQVQVFAHGTRVFQASVIGPAADDARAGPFFDALRVQP